MGAFVQYSLGVALAVEEQAVIAKDVSKSGLAFRETSRFSTMRLIELAILLNFAMSLSACGGNGDDKSAGRDTNPVDAHVEAPAGQMQEVRETGEPSEKAIAAGELECPHPPTETSPGVLKETPAQIARTADLLREGQPAEILTAAADIRSRNPGASPAAITNALIVAFCPTVKSRNLDLPEKKARVRSFASRAYAATAK